MSISDTEVFFPTAKVFKLWDRNDQKECEFRIEEFVFENRIEFIKILAEIFKELAVKNPDVANADNTKVVLSLIQIGGRRMGDIYALVLLKDVAWISKNLTLKKEVELLNLIFEVNDVPLLIGQIQSLVKKVKID